MLNTQQKEFCAIFRSATLPVDEMKDGPKPFRPLGEDIVLFRWRRSVCEHFDHGLQQGGA